MKSKLFLFFVAALLLQSCKTIVYTTGSVGVNAAQYGFTESNPDAGILKKLIRENTHVYIPAGTYKLNAPITIETSDAILELMGESQKTVKLIFQNSGGLVLQKGIKLHDLSISGNSAKGQWNAQKQQFENGYYGIDVQKGGGHLYDMDVYSFMVGLNIEKNHIVSGSYERLTLAYNGNAGLRLIHTGSEQKNNLIFRSIYAVKNGHDSDNLSSNSTETCSGHGFYVIGGYGNMFEACVCEYNSGCGFYIAQPTAGSVMNGCVLLSTYYERNKYANAYVEVPKSASQLNNLSIMGSFYSDSGYKPVGNACSNRELVIVNADNINSQLSTSPTINVEGNASMISSNGQFFSDYESVIKKVSTTAFQLAKDSNNKSAILLNSKQKTINQNNWHRCTVEKGSYQVVVDASSLNGKAYTIVVQLKVGGQDKVFTGTINSKETRTYVLGDFQCGESAQVVMTGTYVTQNVAASDAIYISNLNINKVK